MKNIDGLEDRRRRDSTNEKEILHVADPPLYNPAFSVPPCRRRNNPSRDALRTALTLVQHGVGDGVAIVVLKKDGSAEYWLAGRALSDPIRASGATGRLFDLANRLPGYLSDPFPE